MAAERPGMEIAQLVAEHHQAIYRYAYRLTGRAADAEDLTQQVFLSAQENLGQLHSIDSARSWLYVILRNSFLKTCRKRRPRPVGDLQINLESIPAEVPDDEAIDRERLQQALDELPPDFRLVLVMFYFEDCSYRQMADALKLPIGTVMSRLARAKRYLRAKLFEPEWTPRESGVAGHGG
jgi:RNA polymerase sigma-70 factor (ECF subfamily)